MLKVILMFLLLIGVITLIIAKLFDMSLDYTKEGELLLWYTEKDEKTGARVRKFYKIF